VECGGGELRGGVTTSSSNTPALTTSSSNTPAQTSSSTTPAPATTSPAPRAAFEILTGAAASQAASVVSITLGTVIGTAVGSAVGHLVTALCPVAAGFQWLTTRLFPFQVASGVAGALVGSAGGAAAGSGGAGVDSCFPQAIEVGAFAVTKCPLPWTCRVRKK
jgi:hypothetical protein